MYNIIAFFSTKFLSPIWIIIHKATLLLMGFSYAHHNESNLMRQLKKHFKDKSITFFDVGLNIWSYSAEMFEIFKWNLFIYWFEPVARTFEIAKSNLVWKKNIHIFQFWLAEAVKEVTIHYDFVWEGTASIVSSENKVQSELISLSTIDIFSQNNNMSHIDFLKIDVEWYEFFVLQGAKNLLKNKAIDFIQFEFFRTNIESKIFFKDFWNLLSDEYRIYRILNNSLVEIKKYHPADCEIFLGMNYLAVRKEIQFKY